MNKAELEEKIARLSADFEIFAHITSHDLRDPLRQAVIDCEEIKDKFKETGSEIDNVIESINNVLSKISLLREYSYIANFNKEREDVDCNLVMKKSLEELDDKIKKSGIKITSSDLPVIKGYEPHIIKLFSALIDNAIKFNNSENPCLQIECLDKDNEWEFTFSDNGVGLEEVYREFVFSLFQRLNPEIQDGSFGAGLAFSRKIVENHGGKIWFKSDGENGTNFHFTLAK